MTSDYKSVHPGIFIVFEGVDYAGKTTQANRVMDALQNDYAEFGYNEPLYVKEPGSTIFGDKVRSAFLNRHEDIAPMTEVLALLSCKNELIHSKIRPAIADGRIVICDRFTRTLMAYQGGIAKVPYTTIQSLLQTAGLWVPPDFEVFLNVSAEVSQKWRGQRDDVNFMDEKAERFASDLREGFVVGKDYLPKYYSHEIDVSGTKDEVFDLIYGKIKQQLKFHRTTGMSFNRHFHLDEPLPVEMPEPVVEDIPAVVES